MRLSITELGEITQGRVYAPETSLTDSALRVTWDSRTIEPGDLYLAFTGERQDGHSFISSAIEAGAIAVLGTADFETVSSQLQGTNAAYIQVEEVLSAVSALAAEWRTRMSATVVGLTGSCGKTTTKNLLRDVCATTFKTYATPANQNNELGVPATILNAPDDTQILIVEMGMRGMGQIESLCKIARPQTGIITNIGESHIELLGSRENIARAKAELVAALPAGATAYLNAADGFAPFIAETAQCAEHKVSVTLFDACAEDDAAAQLEQLKSQAGVDAQYVYARNIEIDDEARPSFELVAGDTTIPVRLNLPGIHNVSNAAAVCACALELGVPADKITQALSQVEPEPGRQEQKRGARGELLINDAYNANPDSMGASLKVLASLPCQGCRIAVLGDMGELGSYAQEGHARMGTLVAELKLDQLFCIGELARGIAAAARAAGMDASQIFEAQDIASVVKALSQTLTEQDIVLVKASHSAGLERVVEGLSL